MSSLYSLYALAPQQVSAIYRLQELGKAITQNNQRLSTLRRINSASDDPAGLVSANNLEMELHTLDATAENLRVSKTLVDTAASTAGEILTQLQQAREIALESGGGTLTSAEVIGKQVELDALLRGIDVLAATEFAGKRLLDGSSSYRTTGVDGNKIAHIDILDKQSTSDTTVDINVTTRATQASNSYTGGTLGADAIVTLAGPAGTATISLNAGTNTQDITEAFNDVSYLTGVTASRVNANKVDFTSTAYGSAATFSFSVEDGSFTTSTAGEVAGTDAVATINGTSVTGDGSKFTIFSNQTSLVVDVDPTVSGVISPFTVTGTGLSFTLGTTTNSTTQLAMPRLNIANIVSSAGRLVSLLSGGSSTLTGGNAANALRILDAAIEQVSIATARLGSFSRYTLDGSSSNLSKTRENIATALQERVGTNVPLETAMLSHNQLLQQTTYTALQMFNQSQSDVLALFRNVAFSV